MIAVHRYNRYVRYGTLQIQHLKPIKPSIPPQQDQITTSVTQLKQSHIDTSKISGRRHKIKVTSFIFPHRLETMCFGGEKDITPPTRPVDPYRQNDPRYNGFPDTYIDKQERRRREKNRKQQRGVWAAMVGASAAGGGVGGGGC